MNDKDKLWTISHDIIEMFSTDFGPFKRVALETAYGYIYDMTDITVSNVLDKIKSIVNAKDVDNAKKKK